MNIGHSSLLPYDECAFQARIQTSVDPMIYRLDTNAIWNKNQCYTGFGPRPGYMGNGVSTIAGHPVATAEKLIDIDSVLSNRNVITSKCKSGHLNPINVTKLNQIDLGQCNHYLDPVASRLTNPAFNYKEAPIDRFYNLNQNPQLPIFWNFAKNTDLETKDNFTFKFDGLLSSSVLNKDKDDVLKYTSNRSKQSLVDLPAVYF